MYKLASYIIVHTTF